MSGLGRRIPGDFSHVSKYPIRAIAPETVATVNRALSLPNYRARYNQGAEGACVGFSSSWMMSILNKRFYDAHWLWNEAKKIDEWPDTNPGDDNGTSVRAACDVLRAQGHCRIYRSKTEPCNLQDGIAANRWATNVDEIRTAIASGNPVTLGINWYSNFDTPEDFAGSTRYKQIGKGNLGKIRGGHGICTFAAFDKWQSFALVNSWGLDYPMVLIPYETVQRLINEDGEACLITDR
jgi:hypothetical protein